VRWAAGPCLRQGQVHRRRRQSVRQLPRRRPPRHPRRGPHCKRPSQAKRSHRSSSKTASRSPSTYSSTGCIRSYSLQRLRNASSSRWVPTPSLAPTRSTPTTTRPPSPKRSTPATPTFTSFALAAEPSLVDVQLLKIRPKEASPRQYCKMRP